MHSVYTIATDGVAWSVCVCLFVCLSVTFMNPAKTAEPIAVLFGEGRGADSCGSKEPCDGI